MSNRLSVVAPKRNSYKTTVSRVFLFVEPLSQLAWNERSAFFVDQLAGIVGEIVLPFVAKSPPPPRCEPCARTGASSRT